MKLKVCFSIWIFVGSIMVFANDAQTDGAQNWPQWRGPTNDGVAAPGCDPPVSWSETENIKWKAAIPGRGLSTPIIWGDRIFLLTAIPIDKVLPKPDVIPDGTPNMELHPGSIPSWKAQRFIIICLDRKTGQTIWEKSLREAMPHQAYHRKGSFASESPVTDGEHVYVYFGSQGLFCLDMDGQLIWEKDVATFLSWGELGEGSSPALHGDTLVIVVDHEGQSFIAAYDKKTGHEIWRQNRDEGSNWSTPLIFEDGGRAQVAVNAEALHSYDLSSGKPIWRIDGHSEGAIPVPVVGHGMLFAASGYEKDLVNAIRLGRTGDLTGTDAVAWSRTKGAPYVPSPLLWGDEIYLLEDQNFFSCLNAADGAEHYLKHRLPGGESFSASPVGGAGRIYLLSEDGNTFVVKRGADFELLANNSIGEVCYASPVIVENEIFIRGDRHLFCIAENQAPLQ